LAAFSCPPQLEEQDQKKEAEEVEEEDIEMMLCISILKFHLPCA
jgi:hypothetical protein